MSKELESQLVQTEHERDILGQALGECIEAAGITIPGTPLTGPQLLMFSKDLKRDLKRAALARVAELEKQDLVDVPGPDEIHQMAFEEGQPADDGDGYLFSAEEFDLFVQRLLDSCAAPVAQAQHSVPVGWKLVPEDATLEMVEALKAVLVTTSKGGILRAGIALNAAIAAAPGKEVGHE